MESQGLDGSAILKGVHCTGRIAIIKMTYSLRELKRMKTYGGERTFSGRSDISWDNIGAYTI